MLQNTGRFYYFPRFVFFTFVRHTYDTPGTGLYFIGCVSTLRDAELSRIVLRLLFVSEYTRCPKCGNCIHIPYQRDNAMPFLLSAKQLFTVSRQIKLQDFGFNY